MNLQNLISSATNILVDLLIPIIAAIALLIFFWGLFRSIAKGGDARGVEEGRSIAVWGLLTLFVMVSVWGLVHFIQSGLNITNLSL